MKKIALFLPALYLFATAGPLAAQEDQPAASFEGLVEVSEVLIDVLAVDRRGRVVLGLGKDDFVVEENGKDVELTGVSFYTTRYDEAKSEEEIAILEDTTIDETTVEVPASRYFIFFFHHQSDHGALLSGRRQTRHTVGRHVHEWIRDQMYPSDWGAVLGHNGRLYLHQDFTQDREALLVAVGEASRGRRGTDPKLSEWKRLVHEAGPFSIRRGLPEPAELRKKTRRMYDALRVVAAATRPFVGRKNVLLFTRGFGELDPFSTMGSRPDYRHYQPMRETVNDTNVAIYPLDLTHPDITHTQEHFLRLLALDSGGIYFRDPLNFKSSIASIAGETSGYYLLSFRATHPAGESGYRRIRVKAKDRRVHVRARRGYRYGI